MLRGIISSQAPTMLIVFKRQCSGRASTERMTVILKRFYLDFRLACVSVRYIYRLRKTAAHLEMYLSYISFIHNGWIKCVSAGRQRDGEDGRDRWCQIESTPTWFESIKRMLFVNGASRQCKKWLHRCEHVMCCTFDAVTYARRNVCQVWESLGACRAKAGNAVGCRFI